MADTPGVISSRIIIDTSQVDQATQKVQGFKNAIKDAKNSDGKSALFDGELRSLKELQEGLKAAQAELKSYNAISKAKERTNAASDKKYYDDQNAAIKETSKSLQEQAKVVQSWETARNKAYADRAKGTYNADFVAQMKEQYANIGGISSTKERINVAAQNKYYSDQNKAIKENSDNLRSQIESRVKLEEKANSDIASTRERINVASQNKYYADQEKSIKSNSDNIRRQMEANVRLEEQTSALRSKQNAESDRQRIKDEESVRRTRTEQLRSQMQPTSYSSQISEARAKAEQLFQAMQKNNTEANRLNFTNARRDLQGLVATNEKFNNSITASSTIFDGFGRRVRSHLEWMTSGMLIAGVIGVPVALAKTISDVDLAMASMKQVMPDLHYNQQAFNEETMKFIDIAATYGEKIEDIVKAGTLWGRMYGRIADGVNIVNTLTQQSAIIAVADNMSIVEANKSLEAAMFQYGLIAKNSTEALAYSGRIIDVWTKLAHTGGVSANDLAQGVQRSGAVAKQTGVDFEFLNAMIATTVRATGRSGGEIGNMIKSLLGSIHSKKATDEIEKLGIATKQVGTNGEMELRKAQDVLLDIAVQAGGTSRNLEDLFKGIAGGKWQWSKAASMLGDYKTFIQTWGEAVNSTGFSAEQVGMQLDTVSRRVSKLKADIEGMAVSTGNNGLAVWMKEQVTGIDNIIMGLRLLPKETYTVITGLGGLASALYIAKWAMNQYTIATTAANAATTALARRNLIIAGLVGLSMVLSQVAEHYGALANAERTASQVAEDRIAIEEQQIEQMKKQADFVSTLFSARAKLVAQSNDETLTNEKRVESADKVGVTEEELTKILGASAMERIRQNNFSIESINTEVAAFKQGITEKQDALVIMRIEMAKDLDNKIIWLQNCVDAYYDEASAFGDSISKKITMLGIWKAAMLTAQEWMTKFNEVKRDNASEMINKFQDDPQRLAYWTKIKADADNDIEYHQNKGKSIVNEGVENWKERLRAAKGERIKLGSSGLNFDPPTPGGRVITDDGKAGKDKSNGGIPPSDPSRKIERDAYKKDVTLALHNAKLAADAYAESIDNVNTKEEINGKTANTVIERLGIMEKRRQELNDQEWHSNFMAGKVGKELDDAIGNSEELLRAFGVPSKADWDAMNKVTKAGRKIQNREIMDSHADIKAMTSAFYAWEEDVAKARKEKTKLGNDISVMTSPFKPEEQYKRNIDRNNVTQDILIARSTNRLDMNNEVTLNAIKLHKLLEDKKFHDAEKIRLDQEVADAERVISQNLTDEKRIAAQKQLDIAKDAANKQLLIVEQNAQAIKDAEYAKNSKIKEGLAGITSDILVQGNSLKNIWNKLWNDLANDAIKALFRVNNSSGSLLGSIIGLFGGSSGSSGAVGGYSQKILGSLSGKTYFADGGLVSKPTNALIGETGDEEAVINLSKLSKGDARQQGLLQYANAKMGTQVTANVSQRTIDIAQQSSAEAKMNREHIAELEKQTMLMTTMINVLMNSKSDTGTTMQPIVMQQSMDKGELWSMIESMRRDGYRV
jgi:TP901 family phage tail tape measure protein